MLSDLCSINLDLGLVEKFVELSASSRLGTNTDRPKSWMFALPKLFADSKTASVRYSILAASLLSFAVVHHNKSAELEAVRWYLAGLESHRSSIQDFTLTSAMDTLGPDKDIFAPMMFLYFKVMGRTTSVSWAHHIAAAVKTIESRGPHHYRTGYDHVTFRLSNPSFATIPAALLPKNGVKLCLVDSGDLCDSLRKVPDLGESERQALEREILVVLQNLENWWWQFKQEIGVVAQPTTDLIDDISESFTIPPTVKFMYPDTLTAKSVSLYNSMNIIIYSALVALEECKSSEFRGISPIQRYHFVIDYHSSSILAAAAYQHWRHPFCGDTLRTAFSLKIVSLLAIDEVHRWDAQRMIEDWGVES
ncbi:hypothetical protein NA57DRAFT_73816 [Rhizodiscina lignyota]|uniref:Uncharacterized protein n=1 Tax=Rhizodiscina lignyota TaxID=1504668 RepID=A0A9P4IHP8_9PEZI|nr:hypothetical protein NA57DRAFT_73816 [Rhizodiscina lignyota]